MPLQNSLAPPPLKSGGFIPCMSLGKVNQSKIALKKDGAIQFEPTKKCKYFYGFLPRFSWKPSAKLEFLFKKASRVTQKITGPSIDLLCLR